MQGFKLVHIGALRRPADPEAFGGIGFGNLHASATTTVIITEYKRMGTHTTWK